MATRRQFSREFKVEAVKLVTERGVGVGQAASDLDVGKTVLRCWMRELTQDSQQPAGAGADPAGRRQPKQPGKRHHHAQPINQLPRIVRAQVVPGRGPRCQYRHPQPPISLFQSSVHDKPFVLQLMKAAVLFARRSMQANSDTEPRQRT